MKSSKSPTSSLENSIRELKEETSQIKKKVSNIESIIQNGFGRLFTHFNIVSPLCVSNNMDFLERSIQFDHSLKNSQRNKFERDSIENLDLLKKSKSIKKQRKQKLISNVNRFIHKINHKSEHTHRVYRSQDIHAVDEKDILSESNQKDIPSFRLETNQTDKNKKYIEHSNEFAKGLEKLEFTNSIAKVNDDAKSQSYALFEMHQPSRMTFTNVIKKNPDIDQNNAAFLTGKVHTDVKKRSSLENFHLPSFDVEDKSFNVPRRNIIKEVPTFYISDQKKMEQREIDIPSSITKKLNFDNLSEKSKQKINEDSKSITTQPKQQPQIDNFPNLSKIKNSEDDQKNLCWDSKILDQLQFEDTGEMVEKESYRDNLGFNWFNQNFRQNVFRFGGSFAEKEISNEDMESFGKKSSRDSKIKVDKEYFEIEEQLKLIENKIREKKYNLFDANIFNKMKNLNDSMGDIWKIIDLIFIQDKPTTIDLNLLSDEIKNLLNNSNICYKTINPSKLTDLKENSLFINLKSNIYTKLEQIQNDLSYLKSFIIEIRELKEQIDAQICLVFE